MQAFAIELFTFGTLYFWVLCAFVWILLTTAVEFRSPGKATMLVSIVVGIGCYVHGVTWGNLLEMVPTILGWVACYLAIGVVWAFGKWWFYLRNVRDLYDEHRAQFLHTRGYPNGPKDPIPDNLLDSWQQYVQRLSLQKPMARKCKALILTWMAYWPMSLVWTLIDDPIKKMLRAIWQATQDFFQRLSDRIWADTEDDFRAKPSGVEQDRSR